MHSQVVDEDWHFTSLLTLLSHIETMKDDNERPCSHELNSASSVNSNPGPCDPKSEALSMKGRLITNFTDRQQNYHNKLKYWDRI